MVLVSVSKVKSTIIKIVIVIKIIVIVKIVIKNSPCLDGLDFSLENLR